MYDFLKSLGYDPTKDFHPSLVSLTNATCYVNNILQKHVLD